MDEKKKYLEKISKILLDSSKKWDEYEIAVKGLHSILSEITSVKGAIKNRGEGFETQLPAGFALSPGYAADCTLDTKRTVKYIQALDLALKKLKGKFQDSPINVFYAGTGPFAPFAIPFLMNYKPEEIKFSIADIHIESINSVKRIVDYFNFNDSINEYIQCDLTSYKHHEKFPLHIMITETMHRTLSREPHAMITINMAPQIIKDGIIIPESVKINAVLSKIGEELKYLNYEITDEEINNTRFDLGTVFEVAKDKTYDFSENNMFIKGPVKNIDINTIDKKLLVLLTKIDLFENIELKEKESGITHPYFVQEIGNIEAGDKISFSFNVNQYPKMVCEKVKEEQDVFKALENL